METTQESSETWNDYLGYLDFSLKASLDEYWHWSSDMHNVQLGVVKNYLWLSAIIASAIGAALSSYFVPFKSMNGVQAVAMAALCGGELSAIYSFVSGIRLMLGERDGWRPTTVPSYYDLLDRACGNDQSFKTAQLKIDLLQKFSSDIDSLRKIHSEKGDKIRELNKFTVFSVICGLAGASLLFLTACVGGQ